MSINFTTQTPLKFNNRLKTKAWIKQIISLYGKKCGDISYIFTDDESVLKVNRQFLNHDTYTDIITFDYVQDDVISGDIYISAQRVKENAKEFNVTFDNELHRVIIHGVLHLLGFKDHSPEEDKQMRQKENEALEIFYR
ncbi:MAG: rRNA maturation RNase YbeY [Bacteroidales bacterium]|nr:rRNA maturation RNase YbeY [Bacteroidales bacterium]